MDIIQHTVDKIKEQNNLRWIWTEYFENKKLQNTHEFAAKIYEITSVFSRTVWVDLKPYFVGSENVIQIVSPKVKKDTLFRLLPVQFDQYSTKRSSLSIINIQPQFVIDGFEGEQCVLDKFNDMAKSGDLMLKKSGKICFLEQPLLSATPDYILTPINNNEIYHNLFDQQYCVIAESLGIGECKSRILPNPISPSNLHSAKDWITMTKSKDQQKSFLIHRHCTWDKHLPNSLGLQNELDDLKCSIDATHWSVLYNNQTFHLLSDDVTINLLGDKIGRQILAEAMAIEPFIKGDNIVCRLYLPNFVKNQNQTLELHSCIYCEFHLKRTTVSSIRKSVSFSFSTFLYELQ